jgi:predicted transcriptional regulator
MSSVKATVEQLTEADMATICRQLANRKKWSIVTYIHSARFATATVIIKKLSLNQSTVSKALHSLTQSGLLTREKVGSSIIYQVNEKTWTCIADHFMKLTV